MLQNILIATTNKHEKYDSQLKLQTRHRKWYFLLEKEEASLAFKDNIYPMRAKIIAL